MTGGILMKKTFFMLLILLVFVCVCLGALGESPDWVELSQDELDALAANGETVLSPVRSVPEHVKLLLSVARGELGYVEGRNNQTKYGVWAGDAQANWCAEYLCWCVDQVDQLYSTNLLTVVYPRYSSKNVGRNWFIREGRYISRRGSIPDWGSQWLFGHTEPLGKNGYVPQPGDWMFFAVSADADTTHVAMVDYCTMDEKGQVRIYALEGNKPDRVQQTAYLLEDETIQGYGTVYDLADVVIKMGCSGKKVTALQEALCEIGLLDASHVTGTFGTYTGEAVRAFQAMKKIEVTGAAGHETQLQLQLYVQQYRMEHPEYWEVVADD